MPMNVLQLAQRLVSEVPSIGPKEATKRIARSVKKLNAMHSWSHRLASTLINTEAERTGDSITVTNGSQTITYPAAWDEGWVTAPSMRRIVISGRAEVYDLELYTVSSFPVLVQQIRLASAWAGDTATLSCTLFRDQYALPADCDYGDVMYMVDVETRQRLRYYAQPEFFAGKMQSAAPTGIPASFTIAHRTAETTPRPQIEFGPVAPSDVRTYQLFYYREAAFPTADTDIPDWPARFEDMLWLHAAIEHASSLRSMNKALPVLQAKFQEEFYRMKRIMDGASEMDRQVKSIELGEPDGINLSWRLT